MGFISAVESFISKAEKELASWWGKAPAFANVLSTGITIAGAGLETVFTTPAHGTAFDIVGKGVAKTGALENALRLAARLAASKLRKNAPKQ